jgi:hypothetical protein
MGGSALHRHRHRHHWTTRRDEKRAAGGREWVLKPRRPSRGGSRPAPAERGRDRYWHWQAASCRAVLVLEFLEACVLGECVRGVGAVGRSIAATFRVPTVGRSPAPASAALASFTNFHGHVHASLLPQQYCRPQLVQLDARHARRSAAGGPGSEVQGRPTELLPVRQCLALASVRVT